MGSLLRNVSFAEYDDGDVEPLCVRCGEFVGSGDAAFFCSRCDDMLCQHCVTEIEDSAGVCERHSEAA